jgi:predicted PurR-regulated permease PerM
MPSLERSRTWVLTALALLFCLWLLRSFLVPLTWAFIIALASWPLYRKFAARLPPRFGLNGTALLFTLLVTLLVLGPFALAFVAITGQAQAWAREILVAENRGLAPPEWLPALPLAGSWLIDQWNVVLGVPGGVSRWLNRTGSSWVLGWAESAGGFALRHAMIIVFTVLALFFLYRGGEPLAVRITQAIHHKLGPRGDSYLQQAAEAIRATMNGMVAVSLLDGALCGLAYAVAGLPSAHVWGAITGLLAMIPFLGYVAVAGAALALFAKGASLAAAVIFGWGLFVVFVADKFVRAAIVGNTMRLGFFWVLVGGLAGLETFGLLGLFIGPVILALTGALLSDFIDGVN